MNMIMRVFTAAAFAAAAVASWGPTAGHAAGRAGFHRSAGGATQTKQVGGQWALPDAAYVASVIGVTTATLNRDIAAGQTVLQISGGKFASADDLAAALLAPLKRKLDTAVSSGQLPSNKANVAYSQMHAAYAQLVVTPHPTFLTPGRPGNARSAKVASGSRGASDDDILAAMAAQCHTTTASFQQALAAGGKTPLAICQSTNPNITQGALVAALFQAVTSGMNPAPTTDQRAATEHKITIWLMTPSVAAGAGGKG